MRRSLKAGAVAMALGASIAAASTAEAAVVVPAANAGALARAVAPTPATEGEPQSTTQMLHFVQRRGGFRAGRGYGRPYYGRRYYGRRHYGGYRGGRWVGPAIGAGIAAIIIGGAIAASKDRYRDRWELCDEHYRTFRWSDGTYIPYAGSPRELCPYLRG